MLETTMLAVAERTASRQRERRTDPVQARHARLARQVRLAASECHGGHRRSGPAPRAAGPAPGPRGLLRALRLRQQPL